MPAQKTISALPPVSKVPLIKITKAWVTLASMLFYCDKELTIIPSFSIMGFMVSVVWFQKVLRIGKCFWKTDNKRQLVFFQVCGDGAAELFR